MVQNVQQKENAQVAQDFSGLPVTGPLPIPTLDELALENGTDKASSHHGYTALYEELLGPLRCEPIVLLELGVKDGASLATWREWLPAATVAGVDVVPTAPPAGTETWMGDQADAGLVRQMVERYGGFDVVIDDASHLSSKTIESFTLLWPHLRPGGWYIIEDTHASYHDFYYGPGEANRDPDRPARGGRPTMMQWLRRLADDANHLGRGEWDLYPAKYFRGYEVQRVLFEFNICAVRKRG